MYCRFGLFHCVCKCTFSRMVLLRYFACNSVRVGSIFCCLHIAIVHTFPIHIDGFDRRKTMDPGKYTSYVEIRQETVSSSEVYRTIHSDFMMLKCICTLLSMVVMQRSPRTQCPLFSSPYVSCLHCVT